MTAFLVFVAVLAIIVLYALRQKRPLRLDVRLPGAGISHDMESQRARGQVWASVSDLR